MAGRKPSNKTITLALDRELYDFFSRYAKEERKTMAGILREYILALKRQTEEQKQPATF